MQNGAVSMLAEVPMQRRELWAHCPGSRECALCRQQHPADATPLLAGWGGDRPWVLPAEAGSSAKVFGKLDDFFSQPATRTLRWQPSNIRPRRHITSRRKQIWGADEPGHAQRVPRDGTLQAEVHHRAQRASGCRGRRQRRQRGDDMGNLQDFEFSEPSAMGYSIQSYYGAGASECVHRASLSAGWWACLRVKQDKARPRREGT